LCDKFEEYYPLNQDPRNGYFWVQNPFLTYSQHKLYLKDEELLLELSSGKGLQSKFKSMSLSKFWIKLKDEYYVFFRKSNQNYTFIFFNICETRFSGITNNNKNQNQK